MIPFSLFLPRIKCYPSTSGTKYTAGKYTTEYLEPRSLYLFQCWGGGAYKAKGGYASGLLYVHEKTTIYVVVGKAGASCISGSQTLSAFNGGGACKSTSSGAANYFSGAGASDIRLFSNRIYNRIIVAGGAGGSEDETTPYGGGVSGGAATGDGDGKAGTATGAGTSCYKDSGCVAGSFGQGGNAGEKGNGGGGGWYGGASGDAPWNTGGSGGGGSGFVLTSSTVSKVPGGYSYKLKDKKYYLTSAKLLAGNQIMPSPNGGYETGHSGDGVVKITKILQVEKPVCTIKPALKRNKIPAASVIIIILLL